MKLFENYLNDIYAGNNFRNWFKGSKIVDSNGNPLLLGHATRNFGFNRFKTRFIHLSTIDDAAYFSGGNKRMFRYKKTLDKLSNEEVISIFNKHFSYGQGILNILDDSAINAINTAYENTLSKLSSPEHKENLRKYGIDAQEEVEVHEHAYAMFRRIAERYNGKIFYREYSNGLPRLIPHGFGIDKASFTKWLKETFMTIGQIKRIILNCMFEKDSYMGKGGVYPLCARVVNPFHVNCQGNAWDKIYLLHDNCTDYDGICHKFREFGWDKYNGSHYGLGALDNEAIAILAQELGYDGVIFHNIREGAYGNQRMDTTYIVFSTKQLKSPFENNGDFGNVENIYK